MRTTSINDLLTLPDAARTASVPLDTIKHAVYRAKTLRTQTVLGRVVVTRDDLARWQEQPRRLCPRSKPRIHNTG